MFRLIHLPANQVWVFVFGSTPIRLDGEQMFYPSRKEAVLIAGYHGLIVADNGTVELSK